MANSTISMVKNRKVKEITRVLPPCIGIATAPINAHGFNSYVKFPEFYHTSGYHWLSHASKLQAMQLILGISLSLLLTLLELTPNVRIRDFTDWEWTYGKFKGMSGGNSRNSNGKVGDFMGNSLAKGGFREFHVFFLQNENMESLNGDLTAQQNGCTWDHYGDLVVYRRVF